jgi:hypothetical protein
MKFFKFFLIGSLIVLSANQARALDTLQVQTNDSLTLAQAYVNLTLTEKYFDTLSIDRLNKILPFEEKELSSIRDAKFIKANSTLYNFTYSLLYFNKAQLLFRAKQNTNRETLLQWKQTLDKAIIHFNKTNISSYYTVEKTENTFYDFIAFKGEDCWLLKRNIENFNRLFSTYFNKNIYSDFKRIFYDAKNTDKFFLDSLSYYASMYDLPLSMAIKDNVPPYKEHKNFGPHNLSVKTNYNLSTALDLISQYLQLSYVVKGRANDSNRIDLYNLYHSYHNFIEQLSPEDTLHFGDNYDDGIIPKDNFFNGELNKSASDSLYKLLQKRFPYEYAPVASDMMLGASAPYNPGATRYYFPIPAPFPSAYLSVRNYKPGLATMKQVDDYFKSILNKKGYRGHLHYYYVQSGFALTTSLEKINKDGIPVRGSKRWSVSVGGNGSFSLYETFKSIFFATESDFRIIGLVISPFAAAVQTNAASIGAMQDLLRYSYPSLPGDLQNFSLPQKTLTVLIYDFHQSDIGKVPMLDVSKRLSARIHLERSGLGELLNNR